MARVSLAKDVELAQRRIDDLKQQQSQLEARLANIANIRAAYGNLAAEVRSRSQIVQDAQRQLSEVQAARDAASSCSLVTRIDDPLASETPVGPGRSTIFAGTTLAGLIFGLGAVFLLNPFEVGGGYGRRRSDFEQPVGRRQSDRSGATRQSDISGVSQSSASHYLVPDSDDPDNSVSVVVAATTSPKAKSSNAPQPTEPTSDDSQQQPARRPLPTKPRAK